MPPTIPFNQYHSSRNQWKKTEVLSYCIQSVFRLLETLFQRGFFSTSGPVWTHSTVFSSSFFRSNHFDLNLKADPHFFKNCFAWRIQVQHWNLPITLEHMLIRVMFKVPRQPGRNSFFSIFTHSFQPLLLKDPVGVLYLICICISGQVVFACPEGSTRKKLGANHGAWWCGMLISFLKCTMA